MATDFKEPLLGRDDYSDSYKEELQLGFFRKVFGIITVQLIYTAFICGVFMASEELSLLLIENMWISLVSILLGCICMFLPFCFKDLRRKVPENYINLMIFTTFIAIGIALPCVAYPPELVVIAAILTIGVTAACVASAMMMKESNLCLMISGALLFDVAAMLVLLLVAPFGIDAAYTGMCAVAVMIYAIFIVVDVYLIFRSNRYGVSHEDYVFAAMVIYLDIIQLFLEILKLLGRSK